MAMEFAMATTVVDEYDRATNEQVSRIADLIGEHVR